MSLAAFTYVLSQMMQQGIPLLRALQALRDESAPRGWFARLVDRLRGPRSLHRALVGVVQDMEAMGTFSEALTRRPGVFSRLYVHMVTSAEAGEQDGSNDVMRITLRRLAQYLQTPAKGELERGLRMLGLMIDNGVPLLEALETTREASDWYWNAYNAAYLSVRGTGSAEAALNGEVGSIANAFEATGMPDFVVEFVRAGEATGTLEGPLEAAANACRQLKL